MFTLLHNLSGNCPKTSFSVELGEGGGGCLPCTSPCTLILVVEFILFPQLRLLDVI